MEIQQLEYFLACAGSGSLTGAAEALYTTQPHVSQVIRALEKELGTPLFVRRKTGITLTKTGEQVRFLAESIMKNASLIKESCGRDRSRELRVAANPSSRLARHIGTFFREAEAEGITLLYTECGIEQMAEHLQMNRYDLGFLFVPDNRSAAFRSLLRSRHLTFIPLKKSDLVFYCGKNSPFYGRESVSAEELREISCVQPEEDYFSVEDLLAQRRNGPVVRTNSNRLIGQLLRETALINIGSYLESGWEDELCRVTIAGFEGTVAFGCVVNEMGEMSSPAQRFLAMMKDKTAGTPGRFT